MILTIEQIKDYQCCPMLYYYNYIKQEKPSKTSTIERYALHSLKQTFYWYFYETQDGERPTLKQLKEKFSSLFMFDRTYSETMFMDMKSRARTLETRSAKAISNFHEHFMNDLGVPLLINKEYSLDFDDIKVFGTIPVIRENQLKEVELISFTNDILVGVKAGRNYKTQVQRDIDIIASSIAFKKIYNWDIDRNLAYSMFHEDVYTCKVNGPLMLNLEKIVKQVSKAIDNNIFYPVYNDRCSTCAYRQQCLKEW